MDTCVCCGQELPYEGIQVCWDCWLQVIPSIKDKLFEEKLFLWSSKPNW